MLLIQATRLWIDGDLPAEFDQRLLATLHLVLSEHDGSKEPDEAQDEDRNVRFRFLRNCRLSISVATELSVGLS